jgi:ADP-ribosyl-[dinitrogen reductase] hydrolase
MMRDRERFRGCLAGLAVGDALGTTLEFKSPGTFARIEDMVGGGPFALEPGRWTDDTSMSLCLANSLLINRSFNAKDQMDRYVLWWKHGYMSSTGGCFDIGGTVRGSLDKYIDTGEPFAGSEDPNRAGNGSIMRLAPIPMFYAQDPAEAMDWAAEMSRTTHAAKTCVDACRLMAGIIVGALLGQSKKTLLSDHYSPAKGYWDQRPLCDEISEIASGSYKALNPPDIKGTGYVVQSLEAGLWAFHNSDNFRDGALLAVNLGNDADTTGAVFGQIAGAYYGLSGIPENWIQILAQKDLILDLADRLHSGAGTSTT